MAENPPAGAPVLEISRNLRLPAFCGCVRERRVQFFSELLAHSKGCRLGHQAILRARVSAKLKSMHMWGISYLTPRRPTECRSHHNEVYSAGTGRSPCSPFSLFCSAHPSQATLERNAVSSFLGCKMRTCLAHSASAPVRGMLRQ